MKSLYPYLPLIVAALHIKSVFADSRGTPDEVQDTARICMAIGLRASLTELDDITLTTSQVSGSAGAQYSGQDTFHLESNGQVLVLMDSSGLSIANAPNAPSIPLILDIDGSSGTYTTVTDDNHNQQHQLNVKAVLKAISAQKAGDYSGTINLIVTPALGGSEGCGSNTYAYPQLSTWGTIAYEDLYPHAGDADYNDFVVNFRITENYNSNNQLENIHMDFVPVARGAGYNHSFKLSLDGNIDRSKNVSQVTPAVFTGDAEISVTRTNLDNLNSYTKYYQPGKDLTIFNSTLVAADSKFFNVYEGTEEVMPKWITSVDISLSDVNNSTNAGLNTGEFNYRPYLHVNNTNKDIDLYEVNSTDGMIDSQGYPFGLLIPDQWSWPSERTSIDTVYPYFSEYRAWLSGETTTLSAMAENWYHYPAAGYEDQLKSLDLDSIDNP